MGKLASPALPVSAINFSVESEATPFDICTHSCVSKDYLNYNNCVQGQIPHMCKESVISY